MTRRLLIALLLLALPVAALAQSQGPPDPCLSGPKLSAGATISTATDTQMVALAANAVISVCGFDINQAGGTGTVYLESATAASCGGTLTQQSGIFTANSSAGTATNFVYPPSEMTGLTLPAGTALCVHSTGTIVQGVTVTYVQR